MNISFSYNEEKGFDESDIKAICGLWASTKKKYHHTGHKGQGFKSVFSASDSIIISGNYQFQFKKNDEDLISLLIPIWIDDIKKELDYHPGGDQAYQILSSSTDKTKLFLPFNNDFRNYIQSKNFSSIFHPTRLFLATKFDKISIQLPDTSLEISKTITPLNNTFDQVNQFLVKIESVSETVSETHQYHLFQSSRGNGRMGEVKINTSKLELFFPSEKKLNFFIPLFPFVNRTLNLLLMENGMLFQIEKIYIKQTRGIHL